MIWYLVLGAVAILALLFFAGAGDQGRFQNHDNGE
jgi:hypothetical protein